MELFTHLLGRPVWLYCCTFALIFLFASLVAGNALLSDDVDWNKNHPRTVWQALLYRLQVGAEVTFPVTLIVGCTVGINNLFAHFGWTSANAYLAALAVSLVLVLGAIVFYGYKR